jgi:hypothetical protein
MNDKAAVLLNLHIIELPKKKKFLIQQVYMNLSLKNI